MSATTFSTRAAELLSELERVGSVAAIFSTSMLVTVRPRRGASTPAGAVSLQGPEEGPFATRCGPSLLPLGPLLQLQLQLSGVFWLAFRTVVVGSA